ncbi:hypothetical protein ACFE04_013760 [Oxalis oulophora]
MAQNQEQEQLNKRVVKALYEALVANDVDTVQRLLASDVEWWFHGPPMRQYLMQLLTGSSSSSSSDSFIFIPQSISVFGSTVIVEGYDNHHRSVSWVHAWTINNGIITQVREYFNTSVTVTCFGTPLSPEIGLQSVTCQRVWQSKLCDNEAVPGLVLAL